MKLPEQFYSYTRRLMGDGLYETFSSGLDDEPPVSIRLNPFKAAGRTVVAGSEPVGWCHEGYYLSGRPNFTFDPLFHAGLYYVQEASSMFVAHVVRSFIDRPVKMLDLCAAPGGKTTALMSALPEGSVLFSNEPVARRASILAENVAKFGHQNIIVTCNYPAAYRKSGAMFDAILADVPCSGEGMFRKDSATLAEWSTQKVSDCRQLQRQIITDIWPCLRPGGLLIYSTCTINEYEDEDNINWICDKLGASAVEIPLEEQWHIHPQLKGSLPACRFIPGVTRGEGLFMALLRKDGESSPCFVEDSAPRGLKVILHGVGEDTVKGRNRLPDITKALMTEADRSQWPEVEIGWEQAIAYLRKEAVALPADTPHGIVLLKYDGAPIGWAKNIGTRANNLYPAEWKIKTTHLPDSIPCVLS